MTSKSNNKGLLVILSSPSGGGKTTVIKKLLEDDKDNRYVYSASMTTRAMRKNERDGRDYIFVSKNRFLQEIESGNLLEFETVHGEYYGTLKEPVLEWLKIGKIILMDLDVNGALKIKEYFRDRALLIFLRPPNNDILLQRLRIRSTESEEQINKRLKRLPKELERAYEFDKVIINDMLEKTIKKVKNIIQIQN